MRSEWRKALGESVAALVVCAAVSGLACGGKPSAPAPDIYGPPENAAVFDGQSARFQVWADADGNNDLHYQWLKNGHAIPGATGTVYETPPTEASDDGSAYTVVVTNDGTSAESAPGRLTVHPPLDLRFQWVGAPFVPRATSTVGQSTGWVYTYPEATGSAMHLPILCSALACRFEYDVEGTPPGGLLHKPIRGMEVTYQSEGLPPLPRVQWTQPDTVVTAMNIDEVSGWTVTQRMQTDQVGQFSMEQGTVSAADLQAIATSEGQQSRVITAVSFWTGQVAYVSYGWTLARGVTYEAKVAYGQLEDVPGLAQALSAQGYVITGIGAGNNGANGFVLVGTRQAGHDTPRPMVVRGTGYESDPSILDGYRVIATLSGDTSWFQLGQK